jgi:hypothetical protein
MGRWEKTLKLSIKIDILLAIGIAWIFLGNNLVGCGAPRMDSFALGDFAYTGNIKLNLANVASNQLVVSASPTATSLKFCIGLTNCQPSNPSAYRPGILLSSVSTVGKPKFFVVKLDNALGDDMAINFVATDSTGKIDQRIVKFQKPTPGGGLPSAPGAGNSTATATNTATTQP